MCTGKKSAHTLSLNSTIFGFRHDDESMHSEKLSVTIPLLILVVSFSVIICYFRLMKPIDGSKSGYDNDDNSEFMSDSSISLVDMVDRPTPKRARKPARKSKSSRTA